ncbi:MAG: hypothetical protein WBD31_08370, partial [Rubripirellula sp.]
MNKDRLMREHTKVDPKSDRHSEESEITFRYYEDQWAHARHHEEQMASAAWQLLIATIALVTAFTQTANFIVLGLPLQRIISSAIIGFGAAGIWLTVGLSASIRLHIERARNARRSLQFLEEFASSDQQN